MNELCKKIRWTSLLIVLTILFNTTSVFASTVDMNIIAYKTEVKAENEEEIILDFMLTNFEKISKGVYAYKGKIDYDKQVFEQIEASDFVTKNTWDNLQYNKKNDQFVLINKTGSKQEEVFLQLKLKVKKDALAGVSNVTVKNQTVSEGKEDIIIQNSNVHIKVIQVNVNDKQEVENPETDTEQPNQGTDDEQPVTETDTEQLVQGTDTEQSVQNQNSVITLPNTGDDGSKIIIWIIILCLSIVGIWLNFKDRNLNDKKKKFGIFLIFMLILMLTKNVHAAFMNLYNKGELNKDGFVDYTDVKLIELHLIDLKVLPNELLENADMNSDGNITITDLVLLMHKIDGKLDFKVEIEKSQLENYYPKKNQEIELKFYASVNYGNKVKYVTINDQEYETEQIGDTNEYKVKVKVQDISGIQEFKFAKVRLDNQKEINIKHIEKVDIKKDKPSIENYRIDEDIKNNKATINFDVKDDDNSLQKGYYHITDETGKILKENAFNRGNHKIELDIIEEQKYMISFYGGYDLDTNELNDITGEHNKVENESLLTKQIQVVVDYDLKISDFTPVKQEGVYSKGEVIELQFKSTNKPNFNLEEVVINGQNYITTKTEDYYKVVMPSEEKEGNKEYKLEKVILSNGKEIKYQQDSKVSIEIVKNKPEIKDFKVSEDVKKQQLNMNFKVKDDDGAFENGTVILQDSNKSEISRQEFNEKENKITLPTRDSDIYFIKILANYNLEATGIDHNTHKYKDKNLFSQEIEALYTVKVNEFGIDNYYPEKGEYVKLSYEFTSNKAIDIKRLQINSVLYDVIKNNAGKYEVEVKMQNQSGVAELRLEKIILTDGTEIAQEHVQKVDVLKEKPIVENYTMKDDLQNSKITTNFEIKDVDDSFISGKAQLVKQTINNEEVISEKEIKEGSNKIEFTVDEDQVYKLKVFATYDRDTSTLDNNQEEDNRIENELLFEKEMILLGDYQLEITELKTYKENNQSSYFGKKENIRIGFKSTNKTNYIPTNVVINGKKYDVNTNVEISMVELNGYDKSGTQDIKIEKITLSNGKELNVTNNNTIKIDVLKDKPSVQNYEYKETTDGKFEVSFTVLDDDKSLLNKKEVVITDENQQEVLRQDVKVGQNKISFNKTLSKKYIAKVIADYDLDTNTISNDSNEFKAQELMSEEITYSNRTIEMKDVQNVYLFKQTDKGVENVTSVKIDELKNLEKFIAKVEMKDLPAFYSEIKEYKVENGTLKLKLDYENVVQYNRKQKHNYLEVEFGKVEGDSIVQNTLEKFIELIKENPSGNYEITVDIDASKFTKEQAVILQEFSGTLNFNGHTIKNLSRPLFKSLKDATIENLVIDNAVMTAYGALTPNMTSTTLRNVHITNSTISSPGVDGTGSLVGNISQKSLIENSSATNVTVGSQKRTGGMVGKMNDSVIRNSYVTGKVSSSSDGSGGLIGETPSGNTIENCYVNVETNFSNSTGTVAGISGYSQNVIMKNNLSLAKSISGDEKGFRVFGNSINHSSSNNFELKNSNLRSNSSHAAVSEVDKETTKTKSFYTTRLNWDEKIWNLDNLEKDQYPTLKNADPNNNEEEKTEKFKLYIPGYSRIKKLPGFNKEKEIAYYNMHRLMPYYDAKYYVIDGNQIDIDHVLNTKIIKEVLPFDENGKMIVGLSEDNKTSIKTIKILFEDDTTVEYRVTYNDSFKTVANYKIDDLGIGYNYNKHLVNTNSKVFKTLVEKINSLDYIKDIATLTKEEEARNYTENYPKVKEKAYEFALKFFANNEDYSISFENEVLINKINDQLYKNKMLEKILYAYNYFDRFYGFEIGGIEIADIIFFDGSIFSKRLNSINIATTLVDIVPEKERYTKFLTTFYNNRIKPYTGKSLGSFIEYFIQNLTEEKYKNSPSNWMLDNYWGTIYESITDNLKGRVRYSVWDHMKAREHLILPILSYEGTDMYLLGIPTTIIVGDMKVYFGTNYETTTQEQKLNKLKDFASKAASFYSTIGSIVNQKTIEVMNTKTHINYDSTRNKNWTNLPDIDPVYKAFNEVIDVWPVNKSASAFANGTDVFWMYQALNFYSIFTHENVHNQDGYLFLEGTGRRNGLSMEMFTNGFLTQGFGEFGVVPNYSFNYQLTDNISANLTTERINSREKIYDYYNKMFEMFTILEYLEGRAFLELSPKEQSQLAYVVKEEVISPDKPNRFLRATPELKTEDEFKRMNLNKIEDLWDHKIITARDLGRRDLGSTTFTGSSMWYIPNYDNGPTETSYKTIAYQILGEYGYDGYVSYAGGKYPNDLEALRAITKDPTMTWKKYQMDRYNRVESKLKDIKYFDYKEVIEQMKTSMKRDIENKIPVSKSNSQVLLREVLFGYVKRATNDFRSSVYDDVQEEIHVSTAEEFVEKMKDVSGGNVVLDADLDFSNIQVNTTTIMNKKFTGTINGNNHKITGLNKPLYETIIFATVKDLNIENSAINLTDTEQVGTLARVIQLSNIKNVNLKNVTVKGLGTVGALAGYANKINIKDSIFEVDVTGIQNNTGGLFGSIDYSIIQNVHITSSTITGRGKVGGIIGFATNIHNLSESTSNATIKASGNEVGGLVGEFNNSTIKNSYSLGTITGGNNVGGLVGWIASSKVENSFSNTNISGNTRNGSGGFTGVVDDKVNSNFTDIRNNIAFGRVVQNGYKFDARSRKEKIETHFSNNYENGESLGISTLDRTNIDFTNKINVASGNELKNKEFYTVTLHWDEKIWDFSNITNGGLPKLKNLDPNNVISIIQKTKIKNLEDFKNIANNPSDIYTITNDIDFSSYTGADSVITGIFTGKIEGNGHTLSNLNNATLFNEFRGTVTDLNIKDFNNLKTVDFVSAFAKITYGATLKNMKFENINLSGDDNVAVVSGMDGRSGANSTFENISVNNAKVKGTGFYVSTFIGRKYGGIIKDVYVNGTIECQKTESGGVIGGSHEGVKIENVISNVEITRLKSSDTRNNYGGFIGNVYNSPTIKNSISIGSVGIDDSSTNKLGVYKFAGCAVNNIISSFTNCYEYEEATGLSSVTEQTANHLDIARRENIYNKDFYKNTLHFNENIWNLDTVATNGYPELKLK